MAASCAERPCTAVTCALCDGLECAAYMATLDGLPVCPACRAALEE